LILLVVSVSAILYFVMPQHMSQHSGFVYVLFRASSRAFFSYVI